MMGNKWEDNGVMMGNDGIGMGNTQRFTKSSLGLLFSRSGVKQGKTGCGKAIAKKCRKNKKTLESRSLVCFPRSYFFTFERCYRMRLFAPNRMRGVTLKQLRGLLHMVYLLRRVTSWAPPSTMETAETRVSLAFFCRSGMLVTPTLHMVDFTLYREASTLSCRGPA